MVTAVDYSPFGMSLPGRTINNHWQKYRYGFNGQEGDNEINGPYNSYNAEFWQYDPRVGKRWNLDPKPTVGISEYAAFANNPILNIDPKGDTVQPMTTNILRKMAREYRFQGTGVQFNRDVGKAFESIGLASQGFSSENTKPFKSMERLENTGTSSTVIPDGVRDVTENITQLFPPGIKSITYQKSSFFEVKAVNGIIRLSSSNYQIQGELDAVKNSAAGMEGRGTMTFVTTANTFIGNDVVGYARRNKIQLYQVFAFRETDDNSIHFTPPLGFAIR